MAPTEGPGVGASDGEWWQARWSSWDDGATDDVVVRWDHGGWTAEGRVSGVDVHYVVRLDAAWAPRQFLLFRDLEEPDLWLGTDGRGRWGEINGSVRAELAGCHDLHLPCTPFPRCLAMRRLDLAVGDTATARTVVVDVETLGLTAVDLRYHRIAADRWRIIHPDQAELEVATDPAGWMLDLPGAFRRLPDPPAPAAG